MTPDDRTVTLVIAIELEVKNEQFRFCFMSQNRVVVENKRVLPVLVPSLGTRGGSSSSPFLATHNSGQEHF